VLRTLVTQSRIASLIASFSVREPEATGRTSAPSSRMRRTLGAWRAMSSVPMYTTHSSPRSAQTVAVATPCWPAPVSATTRVLPMRFTSSAWPSALLILWAPVWQRSSRFSHTRQPSASESRPAKVRGVGLPTKSRSRRASSVRKPASRRASA
jgi:hypothetical protein